MGKRKTVLSDADRRKIKRMHAEGMGHKEIAEALNTPRKATYNICYEEDCRNGHRPVTLATQKQLDAITFEDIEKMRNSIQIGQNIMIVEREYESDGERARGATRIRRTLANICDISARGIVARLEAGYTTFFTYAELIRDDGVRI